MLASSISFAAICICLSLHGFNMSICELIKAIKAKPHQEEQER